LKRATGNSYTQSDQPGNFSLQAAGTGGAGMIAPSTLEASTVDLAQEFTNLVTTQRAYSASTKVITTADEMLDELNPLQRSGSRLPAGGGGRFSPAAAAPEQFPKILSIV